MIPVSLTVRRIERERTRLIRRNDPSQLRIGMEQGLNLAIAIIKEVWEENRGRVCNNPNGGKIR